MKLPRMIFAIAALIFALALPSFAQQQNDNDRDRARGDQNTITGCLTKADTGDHWTLTDNQTAAKTAVMGKTELAFDKHANHTVKLTGRMSDDGAVFRVDRIEHVSDSCQAK